MEPKTNEKSRVRVLFICLGNICRSPMAEAVFKHRVRAAGYADRIEVDSAGTGDWHCGQPPHPGTRHLLTQKGIPCDHRARVLSTDDFHTFDYILTMDEQNYTEVLRRGKGRAKVARLLDFAPETGVREVPDPYYDGRFEDVYSLVDTAAAGLLSAIRREHAL